MKPKSETHILTFWRSKSKRDQWEYLLQIFNLPPKTIKITGSFTTLSYGTPKKENIILLDNE